MRPPMSLGWAAITTFSKHASVHPPQTASHCACRWWFRNRRGRGCSGEGAPMSRLWEHDICFASASRGVQDETSALAEIMALHVGEVEQPVGSGTRLTLFVTGAF